MENFLIFQVDEYATSTDGKGNFNIDRFNITLDTGVALDAATKAHLAVSTDEYTPKIGDKLYFLPGVNIPRVKLKNLILDYNVTIVRNVKDSTAVFGSKHSISKMMTTKWYYSLKTEDFKACYEALKPHLNARVIENIDTALEFYTGEVVYSDWTGIQRICTEEFAVYKSLIQNPGSVAESNRASKYLEIISEEYYKLLSDLNGKVILSDGSLVDKLNGDQAIVINSEVYDQLEQMFQSTDEDNHVLAMEIMANSNYKQSLLYMHLLFKEYHYKIANSHTKNHVNFKSLLAYLGKDNYSLRSELDTIVKSLLDKEVLTEEMLNILLKKYSTEIINSGDTGFFKIKNITVSDEVLLTINSNYEYGIRADFTPVVIEEPIVAEESAPKPEDLQWL
jgi:hypothetical protein